MLYFVSSIIFKPFRKYLDVDNRILLAAGVLALIFISGCVTQAPEIMGG
jgi:hypothetical protein